jgi:hypothetical protein
MRTIIVLIALCLAGCGAAYPVSGGLYQIERDAYGMGVHSDQFGRPVTDDFGF